MRFHFRGAVSAGEPLLAVVTCLRLFQQARNRLEPIAAMSEALDTARLELLRQHLLDLNGFGFAAIALDETKSDRGSDNPGPGEFVIHCNFLLFIGRTYNVAGPDLGAPVAPRSENKD
jgi:hypothetical protein